MEDQISNSSLSNQKLEALKSSRSLRRYQKRPAVLPALPKSLPANLLSPSALSLPLASSLQPLKVRPTDKKYLNIWAQENVNKVNRHHLSQQIKGIVSKQKSELKEKQKLDRLNKSRDLEEMNTKIRLYQEDMTKSLKKIRERK